MRREQAIEAGARALAAADYLTLAQLEASSRAAYTSRAEDILDAIGWVETATEWGVQHSQGFVHEEVGHPYSEARARERYADFVRRDATSRWEARGKTRLMRREVTPWSLVPVEES